MFVGTVVIYLLVLLLCFSVVLNTINQGKLRENGSNVGSDVSKINIAFGVAMLFAVALSMGAAFYIFINKISFYKGVLLTLGLIGVYLTSLAWVVSGTRDYNTLWWICIITIIVLSGMFGIGIVYFIYMQTRTRTDTAALDAQAKQQKTIMELEARAKQQKKAVGVGRTSKATASWGRQRACW